MAHVLLQDIEKLYGDVHVVRRLNLSVAQGEFLVLVGASGCGKSTTLRMVAGLESISSGTLSIGGRIVNDVSPRDRDIAMVFQSYALYPHMTVFENMAFGLRIRKAPQTEIDRRVGDAAKLLGLEDLLQRRPAALSGGQRQRVAMGRAVVREPAVFLFDEPLSNLDAKLRVQMRIEIARLHKRLGTTILYVTHDQVEAMTLADRIAVMHEGYLQQCDSPSTIYNRPANTYVATFIGSPAMNLWPVHATVETRGNRQVVLLRGSGLSVELDGKIADRLTAAMTADHRLGNGEWTVGIRPQDLHIARGDAPVHARLPVEVVEPLGAETFVFGELADPGEPLPARDPATRLRRESASILRVDAGQPVADSEELPLTLDLNRLHLFDSAGQRIAAADPEAAVAIPAIALNFDKSPA